jgi:hypothetical protein
MQITLLLCRKIRRYITVWFGMVRKGSKFRESGRGRAIWWHTLAAWLALECPDQIDRALVFAPYLSSSNKLVDLFVQILNIYFEWRTEPGKAHFGYDGLFDAQHWKFLRHGA